MNHIRQALRQLALRPGLSAVVIAMLALGIGATSAMFSMFHQVLLQPLPVPEPHRLVNLAAPGPKWGVTSSGIAGGTEVVFSYPMFRDLEAQQRAFTGIAGHRVFRANLAQGEQTRAGIGMLVSGSYFPVLELQPALGRLIGPHDEPAIGESSVAVLAHDYWQSQFGGDPNVVGRALTVNGHALTIIGVAPERFSGTTLGVSPQVFVPLTLRWRMEPTSPANHDDRVAYWVYLFARLAPGAHIETARASINGLYGAILNEIEAPLNAAMPDAVMERFRQRQITLEPGFRGQSTMPDSTGQPLALVLGATAIVLLIACVNIANLLLVRGTARTGEIAIRACVGASRRHVAGQLLSESAVLAALGGLLGLPVAAITLDAIAGLLPAEVANELTLQLSPAALGFAASATVLTILLFGLFPAWQAARTNPALVIKDQSAQSPGGRGMLRLRALLATTQIALCVTLLILAGLFTQSLMNVARVDLGMDVDSLVSFAVSPRLSGYGGEETQALYDRIEEELRVQPGITSVASSMLRVLADETGITSVQVQGFEGGPGVDTSAATNQVSPAFFDTFSIPLLRGRGFTEADTLGAPSVAVVNESFVRKFELGDDPIGRRFVVGASPEIEIVGVVADAAYSQVKDEVPAQYFRPRHQNDNLLMLHFYVRAGLDPDALMGMIPSLIATIDPALPVSNLMTMRRQVQDNVYLDRLVTMLSASLAALATLLAAVGLYGVLAYNVAQRTRELGLRLALGAEPARLRFAVLRQVGWMLMIGGAIGLAAAAGLGRAVEALLFGLSGHDPTTLLAAVSLLVAVALSAGYLPARRVSRLSPMDALRHQ